MGMGDTADNVSVLITGSVTGLAAAMAEGAAVVKEGTASITESVEGMTGAIEGAMAPLLALFALFESFEFISSAVEHVSELAVSMEILGMKTGMTVEELTALEGAAKLSHVSAEELNTGIQRLSKNMETVAGGLGPAADAMKRLGISATQSNGQLVPTQELLLLLADKFAGMEDGIGKTALAMDLFGRSGAAMVPLLNRGSEGIKALGEEVGALGGVMTTAEQESILRYHEAMERLDLAIDGVKRQFVEGLMPALTEITASFTSSTGSVTAAGRAWRDAGEDLGSLIKLWLAAKTIGDMNLLGSLTKGTAMADIRAAIADIKALYKEIDPLATDPSLGALAGAKKTPPPAVTPKDKDKGPSLLDQWRDQWNHIKEGQLDTDADLIALEIAFWKGKLALVTKGSKEEIDIFAHVVQLETEQRKKGNAEQVRAQKELEHQWLATFDAIPKAWNSAIQSMKAGTASWGDFFRGILLELTAQYAAFEAKQIIIHNAAWLEKKKATVLGYAFEMASSVASAVAQIANYAAVAAAGAWAAMVSIPYIGPVIAPVAAGLALAGVMALAGQIHSAAGGFDVPAGSNPVTQLHAQEMVLPAELANKVRGMTGGEGGGGDHYHFHFIDTAGVRAFADTHRDELATAVKKSIKYRGG